MPTKFDLTVYYAAHYFSLPDVDIADSDGRRHSQYLYKRFTVPAFTPVLLNLSIISLR